MAILLFLRVPCTPIGIRRRKPGPPGPDQESNREKGMLSRHVLPVEHSGPDGMAIIIALPFQFYRLNRRTQPHDLVKLPIRCR